MYKKVRVYKSDNNLSEILPQVVCKNKVFYLNEPEYHFDYYYVTSGNRLNIDHIVTDKSFKPTEIVFENSEMSKTESGISYKYISIYLILQKKMN